MINLIKTPIGFENYSGIRKSEYDEYYLIKFHNGQEMKCSINHPFITIDGLILAKNLNNKIEVLTKVGGTFIKYKRLIKKKIFLYDILNTQTHTYYTNDILSHNCEFLGSSDTLVSSAKLATLAWITAMWSSKKLDVYETPQEGHSYMITVDTSRGQGADYSAFSVFDVTTAPYRQVAKFRDSEIPSMVYPNIIFNVATNYNKAFILVETNDIGSQVGDILFHELEYEHMFCTITMGRGGQKISLGMRKNGKIGVKTSAPMKSIGCSNLKTLIEGDQLIIKDFDTISELTTFVKKAKSYEAEEGRNDDLVMTLVMFSWLVAQPMFKEMTDVNIQKRLFEEREKNLEETSLPFGFKSSAEEKETFVDEGGTRWEFVQEKEAIKKMAKWWNNPNFLMEDDDTEPPNTL